MERLPPELCLRVMGMIGCLATLGNFIRSQQHVFQVFSTYRAAVLRTVIKNQFGENAKVAIFLATAQASGATSEEERVRTIKLLHRFKWTSHHLDYTSLRKLADIGLVVDKLTSLFIDTMAAELWMKWVKSTPPSTFPNAKVRMRRVIYRYWILCEVFSQFSPAHRYFFWASSLDRSTFAEFYRPLHTRDALEIAFFEFCFFPRYMMDVCRDCRGGTCDGTFWIL